MIVVTVASLDWGAVRDIVKRHRSTVARSVRVLIGASVLGQALWMFDSVAQRLRASNRQPQDVQLGQFVVWPLQTIAAFPLRDQAGPRSSTWSLWRSSSRC